jgi:hypothetical protein
MHDKIDTKPCCEGQLGMISDLRPCCSPSPPDLVTGFIDTAAGRIPQVGTSLVLRDILGAWKARWGIKRMNYRVAPGLYAVGNPDDKSPVLVSANYKMSFDRLRKELTDLDAWIMVLDTKGINVWCAAGKGTFGTAEIVKRIAMVKLDRVVGHRTLIVPQLGAPGVAGHEVRKQSGFEVVFGPIKAADIKTFLDSDMKAGRQMRAVRFGFMDRLALTPMEVVAILKPVAIIAAALLVAHLTGLAAISFSSLYPFIGAILIGAVLSPALLPWIPGRAFSVKGLLLGFIWAVAVIYINRGLSEPMGVFNVLALLFLLPAISAFCSLNFTGASTYTSLSGVKREMRFAMPAIIASASAGVVLWVVGRLI